MASALARRWRIVSVLLAAALLVAGCGDDDDGQASGTDSQSDTTSETSAPDTTGSGGEDGSTGQEADRDATLVYATCCVPQVFDPHKLVGGGIVGWGSIYDRLTYIGTAADPLAGDVSPMVAESWEYSDDGLELTLSLRDDVTFNDGSPVDAEAVKASLDRARSEGMVTATALSSVESVEVVDEQTVTLVLSQPDGSLPANLAGPAGAIINPAVLDDPSVDLELAPPPEAGSGPFVLESHEPLTRSVLVRADDDYWDPDANLPARVEILAEPDTTTRLNGLQSGQYQVISLFSASIPEGQRMADSGEYQIHVVDGRTNSVLFLRPTAPPLDDERVRQAIAMAADREGIAEGALNGTCTVNDQLWSPGQLGYDEAYENPYPYDPEGARALIEEAGADGASFEIIYPAGATQETIATAMQAALSEIGLDVSITGIPPTDLLTEFASGTGDAVLSALSAQPDVDGIASAQLIRYASMAEDERYAELLDQGKSSLDPEERGEAYAEISDYIVTEAIGIPFCNAQFAWLAVPEVLNLERMPWTWSALPNVRYLGMAAG